MNLRTHPKAPPVTYQPSVVQPMSYVSPRQTASDNSQIRESKVRRDGADPSASHVSRKLQKQQPKLDKSKLPKSISEKAKSDQPTLEKPKIEKQKMERQSLEHGKKTSQPQYFHVETTLRDEKTVKDPHSALGLPKVPPKDSTSKQGIAYSSATEGHAKERPSYSHALASSSTNVDEPHTQTAISKPENGAHERRQPSVHNIADDETVHISSPETKAGKKHATSDTRELSYVHDFTDCLIDGDILEYYDKEEKRSQNSEQHTLADCPEQDANAKAKSAVPKPHLLSDDEHIASGSNPKSANTQPHAISDDEHADTESKAKTADSQPHALADCPKKKASIEIKSSEQHALADCARERISSPTATEQHALADCTRESINSPTTAEPHPLADCAHENVPSPTAAEQHPLAECAHENVPSPTAADQHPLAECARESVPSPTATGQHSLADCTRESNNSPPTPKQHALADCTRESISSPTTEQHALADCHGYGGQGTRRASSPPDSPVGKHPQAKQHRLASCPDHALYKKEGKADTRHHTDENARINEGSDSYSTVQPSSEHTLSECMSGAKLERQTSGQQLTRRNSSGGSNRGPIKENQDTSDHPQRSRYHKVVEKVAQPDGAKRTSHAHLALSQVLAGSSGKKQHSHTGPGVAVQDTIHKVGGGVKKHTHGLGDGAKKLTNDMGEAVKKSTHNVGDGIQKQAKDMGNAVKKQTKKVRDGIQKQTNDMGDTLTKHTHGMENAVKKQMETVRDETQKQIEKIGGKEEQAVNKQTETVEDGIQKQTDKMRKKEAQNSSGFAGLFKKR